MADSEKNNSTAINEWHMVPIVPLLAISIHKAIYIGGTAEAAETVTGALCYLPVMTKLSFDFRSFAPVCVYMCVWRSYVSGSCMYDLCITCGAASVFKIK